MEGAILLTFVLACAPYHREVLRRALDSIEAQTVPCASMVIFDDERKGAGWARNQGLSQIQTPFVCFLDADDWLEPTFAEHCLSVYDGQHYIYTDHWQDEKRYNAPDDCAFVNGSWHVVTCLLPTVLARAVGGFDETLPAAEDTDFYLKIMTRGICGKRLPEPLFHYGAEGQRGQMFRAHTFHDQILNAITDRYKELPKMGCCKNYSDTGNPSDLGQGQPGDVLARMLIPGPRRHIGRATGRLYEKNANSIELWMNPKDIDSQPEKFARVVTMPPALDESAIAQFRRTALEAVGGREAALIPSAVVSENTPVEVRPNVQKIMGLYSQNP